MTRTLLRCLAGLLLLLPLLAQAQLYKWTDKDGRVHYTDTPPPADARDGAQKKLNDNVVETSGAAQALKTAMTRYPATLYSSADCGALCEQARTLLQKRGVPFSETSLDSEAAGQAFQARFQSKDLRVPAITLGHRFKHIGFEAGAWNGLLSEAGYPKSLPPGMRPPATPTTPEAAADPAQAPAQ